MTASGRPGGDGAVSSSGALPRPLARSAPEGVCDRLADVLDGLGEGVLLLDAAGTVTRVNATAADLLGLRPADLLGRRPPVDLPEPGGDRALVEVPRRAGPPRLLSAAAVHAPAGHDRAGVERLVTLTEVPALASADAVEAQRLLAAARNLTGIALWEWYFATGELVWSPQKYALLGLDPSLHPDLTQWEQWVHPDDLDRIQAAQSTAFSDGRGWSVVFRVVPPDGRTRHLKAWCEPLLGAGGEAVGVIGASLDVTESELAARALEESRQELDAAVRLAGLGSWWEDLARGVLTWSDTMFDITGRPRAAGAPGWAAFAASIHPDDLEAVVRARRNVLGGGGAEESMMRVRADDGSWRVLRAWFSVRTDPSGRPETLWGSCLDVTSEQEHLARLAASRQEFRLTFEQAPSGMAMVDVHPDGSYSLVRVNPALRTLLRVAEQDLTSHHDAGGLPGCRPLAAEDRQRLLGFFSGLTGPDPGHLSLELRLERHDGSPLVAWFNAALAGGQDGDQDGDQHGDQDGDQHGGAGCSRRVLFHVVDLTQRRQDEADLERLAFTDGVTGLGNRARLERELQRTLSGARDEGVGLLLLDLDRFKVVNDSLGHAGGDALLAQAAERLAALVPPGARAYRVGGDEFAVLVSPAPGAAVLLDLADTVLARLAEPYPMPGEGVLVTTASIGVALWDGVSRRGEDLYREADLALNAAKDAGRDTRVLFGDALRARADARMEAEQRLRTALAAGGVRLYLQPVVALDGGQVVAVEALARLEHPELGLLQPAEFIDVAEDTGLVVEIDCRMAELAVAHLARPDVDPALRAAVNVSPRTLDHPDYPVRLARALTRHGVPAGRVLVEVTESSVVDARGSRTAALLALRELGVQVGIDDFGTGYSMLAYLDRFPLDFLKVDRSFVARLGQGPRPDALVQAIVSIAHAHGLTVTAEGVETPEQAQALRALGCERGQGWLFGRPAPAPR